MKWYRSRRAVVVSALGVLVVVALGFWWWRHRGLEIGPFAFKPLPAGQPFVDAASSCCFRVHGTVTLRDQETPGQRVVTFDVLVENKTGRPIRGLLVTAELSGALAPYSNGQGLTFGSLSNPVDLVPGQKPYGLISSRIQTLPDPYGMTDSERQRFYGALRQPIRVGLWWQGGEEFLELQPADIDYVGFP